MSILSEMININLPIHWVAGRRGLGRHDDFNLLAWYCKLVSKCSLGFWGVWIWFWAIPTSSESQSNCQYCMLHLIHTYLANQTKRPCLTLSDISRHGTALLYRYDLLLWLSAYHVASAAHVCDWSSPVPVPILSPVYVYIYTHTYIYIYHIPKSPVINCISIWIMNDFVVTYQMPTNSPNGPPTCPMDTQRVFSKIYQKVTCW